MTTDVVASGCATAFQDGFRVIEPHSPDTGAWTLHEQVLALRSAPELWLDATRSEIDALSVLPENWDSYGAHAVGSSAIDHARGLMATLARVVGVNAPTVTATPEGDVGLCWDVGRWSLDASVDPSGLVTYVFLDEESDGNDQEGRTRDPAKLASLLARW